MRETQPTVRLIARPQLDWNAVQDYLASIPTPEGGLPALDWYHRVIMVDDTPPRGIDAELLVEYAGRRCYRSWAPGLNANVTKVRADSRKYLENVLRSKHGSVLEHAQFTFDFDDVSRVFTHELVRHRAGVAISQESLRFVRLTDLSLRIPPILENGPRVKLPGPCDFADAEVVGAEATADYCYAHQDFCDPDRKQRMGKAVVSLVERLEEFQRDAAEAFGLDEEGVPFHYKKEVTSALRRLAPMGLSTGMVWSANIRTLRHVITMRTAPGAEEEIRLVYDMVARIMKEECPNLFQDFHPVSVDEGNIEVPHWVPEYEKV